jgi:hypothetical protein
MARRRSQKLYKMKGCSKTRKNCLTGGLAYPSNNIPRMSNSAYTGKGGASCGISPQPSNLAYSNINSKNPIYPSTGPRPDGFDFLNSQVKKGGCCDLGISNLFKGGCGSTCPVMSGGTGNNGIPYPNGSVGTPWIGKNTQTWPGVDKVPGNSNHFPLNKYSDDVSRQMINTGSAPPFSVGGGRRRKRKNTKKNTKKHRKSQKGGIFANTIGQDVLNLGRQINYNLGSSYNAIKGYQAPVNPMPWKGQFPRSP